jgi:hypothetical protein
MSSDLDTELSSASTLAGPSAASAETVTHGGPVNVIETIEFLRSNSLPFSGFRTRHGLAWVVVNVAATELAARPHLAHAEPSALRTALAAGGSLAERVNKPWRTGPLNEFLNRSPAYTLPGTGRRRPP